MLNDGRNIEIYFFSLNQYTMGLVIRNKTNQSMYLDLIKFGTKTLS